MTNTRKRAENVSNQGNGKAKARAKRSTAGTKKVQKTYTKDDRGCEHDNPDFWHLASKEYSRRSWRKKKKCCPSLKCSNCKETV